MNVNHEPPLPGDESLSDGEIAAAVDVLDDGKTAPCYLTSDKQAALLRASGRVLRHPSWSEP